MTSERLPHIRPCFDNLPSFHLACSPSPPPHTPTYPLPRQHTHIGDIAGPVLLLPALTERAYGLDYLYLQAISSSTQAIGHVKLRCFLCSIQSWYLLVTLDRVFPLVTYSPHANSTTRQNPPICNHQLYIAKPSVAFMKSKNPFGLGFS